ncbi:MAG: hypothetical protein B6U73_04505 [Desulfurococcales archaeon ex4484_204]|nr:MAG: hypothetical protein B6U73_04505 [Desulfurococcales archaeon ex4484_204]
MHASNKANYVVREFDRAGMYGVTKCYKVGEGRTPIDCRVLVEMLREGPPPSAEVCNERVGRCISFSKGDKLLILEVKGREVYLLKDECERVSRNERLGYVITGKGEVRVVSAPDDGYVLLLNEVLGERSPRYQVFIVVEDGGGGGEV